MSTEPLHDTSDSRTNLQRRRRPKQPQDHSSFPDSSTSEAGPAPLRRASRTATVARAARSMLGSGSGSSALESQLAADAADDPRSYQPSLSRIAEGRTLDARGAASTPARNRPRVGPRSRFGRYPVEDQRRLQERVRAALTSPSMQSVLSSLTTATSSSSGSNSTLTQGSFDRNDTMPRQEQRRSRHISATRHGRERRRRLHHDRDHRDYGEPPPEPPAEKVNVFNFLESEGQAGQPGPHDPAWLSDHASSSSEDSAADEEDVDDDDDDDHVDDDDEEDHDLGRQQRERIHRTYTPTSSSTHSSGDSPLIQHKSFRPRRQWAGQDQPHSDSGISVRGGSPDSLDRAKQPRVEAEEDAGEDEAQMDNDSDEDEAHEEEQEDEGHLEHSSSRDPSPAIPAANHGAVPNHPTAWRHAQPTASGTNGRNIAASHLPPQPPPYSHASLVPYTAPPPMHLATLNVPPPAPEPPPPTQRQVPTRRRTNPQPAGYDALATALSPPRRDANPPPLPPLYRRFERLNHRILLHLQDEIAEMEEALHALDANIARASPYRQHHPASRRADARFGSDAHFARTDLLGRIFIKLRDYNDALSGFRGALAAGPAAPADDLARYRARMDELRPVAQNELRFLGAECEADLVRVGPAHDAAAVTPGGHNDEARAAPDREQFSLALLAVAASLAVAACAFSYVKNIAARLALVAVLAGAAHAGLQYVPYAVIERERRVMLTAGFAAVLVGMAGIAA